MDGRRCAQKEEGGSMRRKFKLEDAMRRKGVCDLGGKVGGRETQ